MSHESSALSFKKSIFDEIDSKRSNHSPPNEKVTKKITEMTSKFLNDNKDIYKKPKPKLNKNVLAKHIKFPFDKHKQSIVNYQWGIDIFYAIGELKRNNNNEIESLKKEIVLLKEENEHFKISNT